MSPNGRGEPAMPASVRKSIKRVVVRTLWGPYTTRYLLGCGHWVTRKTPRGVPAMLECDQCHE